MQRERGEEGSVRKARVHWPLPLPSAGGESKALQAWEGAWSPSGQRRGETRERERRDATLALAVSSGTSEGVGLCMEMGSPSYLGLAGFPTAFLGYPPSIFGASSFCQDPQDKGIHLRGF